ncbi:MAG: hypothetical protein ACI9Y1_001603 [Lentisphaeria bacterium]|jgi:hypothetical protein
MLPRNAVIMPQRGEFDRTMLKLYMDEKRSFARRELRCSVADWAYKWLSLHASVNVRLRFFS